MRLSLKNKVALGLVVGTALLKFSCSRHIQTSMGEGMDEDIEARMAWEKRMLADPATGLIPERMRARELAFAATLPKYHSSTSRDNGIWKSRGPYNVGGRTRAIAIDLNDENTILAGSISNGIWRSTDAGSSWKKTYGLNQVPNITCIAQQSVAGQRNVWYCGTGEYIGNSASGDNAFFLGDGLLKSTDRGLNWHKLASTSSGTPQSFNKEWQLVYNVATNPLDSNQVYAATYGSIYRSADAGATWGKVKGSINLSNSAATYTDVAVSPKGVIYCTLSSDATQRGVYRSNDSGKTWTNILPSNFPTTYNRVVIGISKSDDNQVWFLGVTPNAGKKNLDFQKKAEYASLWKYNATTGQWWDLSQNLPSLGGDFGNFISQGGYDLYVRVKPDDTATVFIGGTNLWRSTDGFTTSNKISWIGGYGVNTTRPNYQLYDNHHPDQHNLVFYPSDPKKMISTDDGGIQRTTDNTASNVVWSSLNNGYISSQFYSIAIDHATANDDEISGGLQDNGTFHTNSSDASKAWNMIGNSDGCFTYIANGRTDYYVGAQLGKVYHIRLDNNGKTNQWARVDPLGAKGMDFVNPYALDPNQQSRMYYLAKNRIWINDDVTQIPLHNQLDTVNVTTGWSVINATIDTTKVITALSVSTKPADILYYGTSAAKVYKLSSASSGSPVKKDITGSAFPVSGSVNCIAIDPNNADRVLVVFSNYNIRSLFYTANGGTSWTDVSGNLEQFTSSGLGNGPSCRWAGFLPIKDGKSIIFVGTSIGLFSTDTLKANNGTVWTQQYPDGIGNAITTAIDIRPIDGLVAVATHGAGIYTGHFYFGYQATGIDPQTNSSNGMDLKCYPNPATTGFNIEINSPENQQVYIEILDEYGRVLKTMPQSAINQGQRTLHVDCNGWPKGIYYCRVVGATQSISKTVILQ